MSEHQKQQKLACRVKGISNENSRCVLGQNSTTNFSSRSGGCSQSRKIRTISPRCQYSTACKNSPITGTYWGRKLSLDALLLQSGLEREYTLINLGVIFPRRLSIHIEAKTLPTHLRRPQFSTKLSANRTKTGAQCSQLSLNI